MELSDIADVSSFKSLQNGAFFVQGDSHEIIGTHYSKTQYSPYVYVTIFNITVKGDLSSVENNSEFRLYDDDDFGLIDPPLPRRDLVNDQMKNYFYPSFVEVIDAVAHNSPDLIPLHLNEDVSYNNPATVVDDEMDLFDENPCWVCPVTAAYQGGQGEDQDPHGDPEGFLMGETAPHGNYGDQNYYDHSTVFVETCRENYDTLLRATGAGVAAKQLPRLKKWITAVISHEMGHQPGNQADDHPEGGLMAASMEAVSTITPEDAKFKPKTIKRFRNCNRWSK